MEKRDDVDRVLLHTFADDDGFINYPQFRDLEIVALGRPFSEVLLSYFKETDLVSVPKRGRLFPK